MEENVIYITFVQDNQTVSTKCDEFYHANDERGIAWTNPEIGVQWSEIVDEYKGTARVEGYSLDGVALNLRNKD